MFTIMRRPTLSGFWLDATEPVIGPHVHHLKLLSRNVLCDVLK